MEDSLFARFISEKNFLAAHDRVRRKKAFGGIDRVTVEEFGKKLDRNLATLRKDIEAGRYTPQPVQAVSKPKFNDKGEFRQLGLPTVADKVVQAALLQVVEPLAEKLFLDTSYGYRAGKGHYKAIRRVEHNLGSKLIWTVHQDVDNFFDTLDHDRLLRVFAELVGQDRQLVELVALWCRSGIVAKSGKWRNVETGVRQGQVISPLLANLYLHELDAFVHKKGWGWVRYADDYLVQVKEEETARRADREIKEFLETTLHLKLNANKSPVTSLEQGFTFLGVSFKGDKREIAAKKISKMHNRVAWLLSGKNKAGLEKILRSLGVTIDGWQRYYGFLNPEEQFARVEKMIEQKFLDLARQRIDSGSWPKKPPTGSKLPLLTSHADVAGEGARRLQEIWKQAQPKPTPETEVKKRADRKIGTRRRRHQRQQVAEGEILVTTPGHFVGRRGERIIVRRQQNIVAEVPGAKFSGLTMGGHGLSLSTDVIKFCTEKDISVHFIDGLGKIFAVAHRPDGIRADLVHKQINHRDDQIGLLLARMFIWGKVKNQFAVLKSFAKYKARRGNRFTQSFAGARGDLEATAAKIKALKPVGDPRDFRNTLMGLEGSFGAHYWRLIGRIIPVEYEFRGRKRRGATDLVNSLLNYGYGILYAQALTAVTKAGLNAMSGFLHAGQGKKPVLTFDLVEEFRAPVVDRAVFSMLNRREQLGQEENGLLDKGTRRKVAAAVTARLGNEAMHRGKKDTMKNILHGQAISIRDFLRGKGGYKPFLARW